MDVKTKQIFSGAKAYTNWIFKDGTEVHEIPFDNDLHRLAVWVNAGETFAGYITPSNIEDMEKCIANLDNGSHPIEDRWEDGNGNTCNSNGWGLKYSIDIDDYNGDYAETLPAFTDWKDAVADFKARLADGETLKSDDYVYVVSGVYLGVRVWAISLVYYGGAECTADVLNDDDAWVWWDTEWDSKVDAE